MKIQQISIFLANKPGALDDPCRILAQNDISISALTLADTKEFGILRLVLKDTEKACKVLSEAGMLPKLTDVVAIEVDHKSGSLAKILETFTRNQINVEYLYAFPAGVDGKAVIIFRFDDPDTAIEKLKKEHDLVIVTKDMLFAS
ncbi:MAG: amino acid-binding protein [Lentisphaeria bacterium]|nr:amino acid-binding protein [Lentisphaeria bacterium]